MQQILYMLLICYLLPLILMIVSAALSGGFQTGAAFVTITEALSTTFLDSVRSGLATLLIPVITKYSFDVGHPNDKIPPSSKRLIHLLFSGFFASFVFHAIVVASKERLVEYSPQAFEAFKQTSYMYIHELLTYISIVVVIASSRSKNSGESVYRKAA